MLGGFLLTYKLQNYKELTIKLFVICRFGASLLYSICMCCVIDLIQNIFCQHQFRLFVCFHVTGFVGWIRSLWVYSLLYTVLYYCVDKQSLFTRFPLGEEHRHVGRRNILHLRGEEKVH